MQPHLCPETGKPPKAFGEAETWRLKRRFIAGFRRGGIAHRSPGREGPQELREKRDHPGERCRAGPGAAACWEDATIDELQLCKSVAERRLSVHFGTPLVNSPF